MTQTLVTLTIVHINRTKYETMTPSLCLLRPDWEWIANWPWLLKQIFSALLRSVMSRVKVPLIWVPASSPHSAHCTPDPRYSLNRFKTKLTTESYICEIKLNIKIPRRGHSNKSINLTALITCRISGILTAPGSKMAWDTHAVLNFPLRCSLWLSGLYLVFEKLRYWSLWYGNLYKYDWYRGETWP